MSELIQKATRSFSFLEIPLYDAPIYVDIDEPETRYGSKIVCIKERGRYVLESGPTLIRSIACTHAGSGGVIIYDGVPDHQGFFVNPDFKPRDPADIESAESYAEYLKRAHAAYEYNKNGREIYYAHPACMGCWMLDGGLQHGLTIENRGSHEGSSPVLTVTWQRIKSQAK